MTEAVPYGWNSYRQNLILLYEDLGRTNPQIDALIDKTEYRDRDGRPDFAAQWNDLNQLEARIFMVLDDTRMVAETERKFVQAKAMGLAGLEAFRERFRKAAGANAALERRAISLTLLEEMFVKYSYRFAEREKRREVSWRLTSLGLVIIGIPIVLLFASVLALVLVPSAKVAFDSLAQRANDFSPFFVVIYFGIVGAYFSRLFSYQKRMGRLRWNQMDLSYSLGAIAVRLLVGAIGAALLFFMMVGGILAGPLFVSGDFTLWWTGSDATTATTAVRPLRPSAEFARLIVWSTLAGFSERFVPERFGEIEEGARGSGKPRGEG